LGKRKGGVAKGTPSWNMPISSYRTVRSLVMKLQPRLKKLGFGMVRKNGQCSSFWGAGPRKLPVGRLF